MNTTDRDSVLAEVRAGRARIIKPTNCDRDIIVDAEDYGWLNRIAWLVHLPGERRTYAKAWGGVKGRMEPMHRILLVVPPGYEVDHINGDGLDNRLGNLRHATRQQNSANSIKRGRSSRFKGVCWDRSKGKWLVGVKFNYRRINLGRYDSEEQAALAYDAKARELFGEFARCNFPP